MSASEEKYEIPEKYKQTKRKSKKRKDRYDDQFKDVRKKYYRSEPTGTPAKAPEPPKPALAPNVMAPAPVVTPKQEKEASFRLSIPAVPQLHIPGYNFCGPGTRDMGRKPINALDALCKQHDIQYGKSAVNPYMHYLDSDDEFLRKLKKLKLKDYKMNKDALFWRDTIVTLFETKKRRFPRYKAKRKGDLSFDKLYKTPKGETPKNIMARRRYTGKRKSRKTNGRKSRYTRKKYPKKYSAAKSKVGALVKAGFNSERYRIDRGIVSTSDMDKCGWSVLPANDFAELQSRLGSLVYFDRTTEQRETSTKLDEDPAFKAYIRRSSTLTVINNQNTDENTGGQYYTSSNIIVDIYLLTPKFPETVPLTDLEKAYRESTGDVTSVVTEKACTMRACSKMKKLYYIKNYGHFNMNPGEKRVCYANPPDKWWQRYKQDLLGTNYDREWDSFWLIRQQGDIGMNSILDVDGAKPFYMATRLANVSNEYSTIYYDPAGYQLKTYDTTNSATIDTVVTATPQQKAPQEVDDEIDQPMGGL